MLMLPLMPALRHTLLAAQPLSLIPFAMMLLLMLDGRRCASRCCRAMLLLRYAAMLMMFFHMMPCRHDYAADAMPPLLLIFSLHFDAAMP